YAFHLLVGHHGVFSLTPIFLFTAATLVCFLLGSAGQWLGLNAQGLKERIKDQPPSSLQAIVLLTAVLSLIVIGFYIFGVNDRNRNYGGWTTGLRWLVWLTPFWLLSMLPSVDWLAQRRW